GKGRDQHASVGQPFQIRSERWRNPAGRPDDATGRWQTRRDGYFPAVSSALTYSRVMRAMFEIGISFGHTASHSPSFEQLPKPSASARSIMATTREWRSTCPCGSRPRWEIFALMNRCADAFLQ